jgi:5-methylcytosine-specific restriction protein A
MAAYSELKGTVGTDILTIKTSVSEDSYQAAVQAADTKTLDNGPAKRKSQKKNGTNSSWSRDAGISKAALNSAGYKCEVDETHLTFISKASGQPFMEAHHMIPMEYQDDFTYSIDVPENVISLCPNCHRKAHLSVMEEKESLLEKLLTEREMQLKSRGIEIDRNRLLSFYK